MDYSTLVVNRKCGKILHAGSLLIFLEDAVIFLKHYLLMHVTSSKEVTIESVYVELLTADSKLACYTSFNPVHPTL